jgi:hypothetical protein
MRFPVAVDVSESSLMPISARQPAKEVVEAAIFHHHHNDVIDAGIFWRR